MLRAKNPTIGFMDVVRCARSVVELGCEFSHLCTELHNLLRPLKSLLEKRTQDNEKLELLMISYHCCRNIAVDFRFDVCRFTEAIGKHIREVLNTNMDEDSKRILFKLMDVSILVHHPSLGDGHSQLDYIDDKAVWCTQLRNYEYAVEQELKLPLRAKYGANDRRPEVDQVLVQFAARLNFLIHWDDSLWVDAEDNEEASTAKRSKTSTKLQSLMDFAQPSANLAEFNWKWLTVIGETIWNFPSALRSEDFQPLLLILSQCQPMVAHESHVYAFTKCCVVLLRQEEEIAARLNPIVTNLCLDYWNKIADGTARVCTSNNKHSLESHILLQTLIRHQKFPSPNFIEDVVKIFLTKSTIKCDATLQTLITIMKSFNLDSLPNGKDLASRILSYTFEKPSLGDLKGIITTTGSEKPSARVLSQLGAICCLAKADVVKFFKNANVDAKEIFERYWKLPLQTAYKAEVEEITRMILLKSNERLLIEEEKEVKKQARNESFPAELKCILDPVMLEELQRVTEFKTKVINEDSVEEIRDYLQLVMENNEIMMNLADSLLSFEAYNEDKFKGSFVVKKLEFHLQEIERLFDLLLHHQTALDMKETHQLLTLVKSLFSSDFHKKIGLKVRSAELEHCLRWVAKQVNHKFLTREDDEVVRIGWEEFAQGKMEEKLKFLAVEALCEYNNHKGHNEDVMVDRLLQIELDCDDNFDLHAVFNVLRIFDRQESVPKEAIQWIWTHIVSICQRHHRHQYLSDRLIGAFHDVVKLSKNHPELTTNVITLFSSYAKMCASPDYQYSPATTVGYLRQFQNFHRVSSLRFFSIFRVFKTFPFRITSNCSSMKIQSPTCTNPSATTSSHPTCLQFEWQRLMR